MDHLVFVNMEKLRFYILPDDYEVYDESLKDICSVIEPKFDRNIVLNLDKVNEISFGLQKKSYLPGFKGLNDLGKTDYMNVIIHIFNHIKPFRNFFLLDYQDLSKTGNLLVKKTIMKEKSSRSNLIKELSYLIRSSWNFKSFKTHISPHRLVQTIYSNSNKIFKLDIQNDPHKLLMWLLNQIHVGLMVKTNNLNGSIVYESFGGNLIVESKPYTEENKSNELNNSKDEDFNNKKVNNFLVLSLDLPITPLFDGITYIEEENSIDNKNDISNFKDFKKISKNIPQISLMKLLENRYDGKSTHIVKNKNGLRLCKYKITKLPRYLIIHYKRFTSNNFIEEKNKTIITFPIKNLDMKDFLYNDNGTEKLFDDNNSEDRNLNIETKYNLLANIIHEGSSPSGGNYKIQIEDKANNNWYEIQNLFIEKVASQMLFLSDTYIQIWERNDIKNDIFA